MSGRASPIVHAISPQAIGIAAAMLTVTIWAGWFVATRHSVLFSLGPNDVGILRFGVPAIVLAPAWMRVGFFPSTVPARFLILIVLGSGASYFLVVANATRFANAADVGAMLPGLVPMWTALFGWLIFGERFSALQALGYTLAVLGVLAICALRISSDATANIPCVHTSPDGGSCMGCIFARVQAKRTDRFRRSRPSCRLVTDHSYCFAPNIWNRPA